MNKNLIREMDTPFIKSLIMFFIGFLIITFGCSLAFAYNPNSFIDKKTLFINGKRPRIDVNLSAFEVTINPNNFINGIANETVVISNDGNVPCYLTVTVQNVPVDLNIEATIDTDVLFRGESTNLNLSIELTDMQETDTFNFTILIEARLRP